MSDMTNLEISEYFDENHVPDPVSNNAVRFAMAATEPSKLQKLWDKIIAWLFVGLIAVSIYGGYAITHQNHQLHDQNKCLVQVVLVLQQDKHPPAPLTQCKLGKEN